MISDIRLYFKMIHAIEFGRLSGSQCRSGIGILGLPDSLRIIGDRAFYECYGLRMRRLPKGLKRIGDEAFYDCYCLKKLEIPEGVTSLGENILGM